MKPNTRTAAIVRMSGRDALVCCPWHDEKTPSLVAHQTGVFACLGCRAHGRVKFFTQHHVRLMRSVGERP